MPTWNLAPTTKSLVILNDEKELAIDWLTWGLGNADLRPINARVETAPTKPMFREAWRTRRCAVPADGWYEWRLEQGRKQPYYFVRRNDEPLFFAGLWTGNSFCILTTAADGELRQIHDRRPLALPMEETGPWLEAPPSDWQNLIGHSVPAAEFRFHPVAFRVSSPRNDGPELIQEVIKTAPPPQTGELDLFPNPT